MPSDIPRAAGNPSRVRLFEFVQRAASQTPAGALVLDAGAGDMPYRGLWDHVTYESADVARIHGHETELTYVCDLSEIPVEDARYDVVLLTQVLEHLPDPQAVLRELARVLKHGGRLYLSTPFYYEEHEAPYDFHRYTQYGLSNHLGRAGFDVDEIDWLEGYFGTLGYQARLFGRAMPRRVWALPARAAARGTAAAFNRLELQRKVTSVGHPKNYAVVASRR